MVIIFEKVCKTERTVIPPVAPFSSSAESSQFDVMWLSHTVTHGDLSDDPSALTRCRTVRERVRGTTKRGSSPKTRILASQSTIYAKDEIV